MSISIACGFICGLIEEAVLSGFQTMLYPQGQHEDEVDGGMGNR